MIEKKKMRKIDFIVLFTVLSSFSFISSTNEMWILTSPKRFQHSYFQPLSSDQSDIQDDFNEIPPFLFAPFLNFFRQRTPFRHVSEEIEETTDKKSINSSFAKIKDGVIKLEDSKENDSFHRKVDGVAQNLSDVLSTTTARHHIEKKFMESLDDGPFHKRILDPLRSIDSSRNFYSRHSGKNKRYKTSEQEGERQNTTYPVYLGNFSGNETEVAILNSTLTKERGNCTQIHFMSRYFFIWKINWSMVALQVAFLMLVAILVSLGVFICRVRSSDEQHEEAYIIRKQAVMKEVKPLTV